MHWPKVCMVSVFWSAPASLRGRQNRAMMIGKATVRSLRSLSIALTYAKAANAYCEQYLIVSEGYHHGVLLHQSLMQ